jgi:hypothetical protein
LNERIQEGESDRRSFFRKLVAVAAATGVSGLLLGKLAEPVSAASSGEVAFYTGSSSQSGDPNLFWDNVNKRLGVDTSAPEGQVHVGGSATADVFCGLGPHPATGPAMNYGYSGSSFGRGSGFFNVRPDPLATPPNPSLRFMTANTQRMIITNTGLVGIGTSTPLQQLTVAGDVGQTTSAGGLVKAGVLVNGGVPSIIRSFNNLPGGAVPTVTQPLGPGTYEVNFGVDVSQRFYTATLLSSNSTDPGGDIQGQILASTRDGNPNAVFVRTNDTNGPSTNRSFYLMIC